ncbi:uncharacterized protein [Salminus brasiliensis]|uniref:uncharacterized protein n=1 Tax=Salminus brasiliensis TaxID=930266 RepID=UPI003B82F1BC
MDESLWSEKSCSSLISALPLWIIEHAWSHRMADVLEVLGPPLWLEGDCGRLRLEDPCSIRVMAAEAWMVIRARDIKHFERVMEFLEVIHVLMPQLVTAIKHMKIMFGLKTLVVMWMLWDDHSVTSITGKITRFFPDNLPQYQRSSRRHLELMQKTQQDFRRFAQSLARNPDLRKAYIRDLLEEQYGERYAIKVEERLLHYLKELDKALPQPTHIDQVLQRSLPLEETEKLLHQLLTCNSASLPTALKRLLRCAMAAHSTQDDSNEQEKRAEADRPVPGPFCVAFRPSQEIQEERTSQKCSQGTWLNREKSPSLLQTSLENINLEGPPMQLKPKSGLRLEITGVEMNPCVAERQDPQREKSRPTGGQKDVEEVTEDHMCSKHGKKMKSILLECSEELQAQNREVPLAHSEGSPPSPLAPLRQSTPQRPTHSSASPLQDSSSTYVSLSSHPDSSFSSTDLSRAKAQEVSPQSSSGQPVTSSLASPVQQNTSRTSSVQQLNISANSSLSAEQILPFLLPSLQKIAPSAESSCRPFLSQMSLTLPTASASLVQQASSSPFTRGSASTSHDLSPAPTSSSSVQRESSSSVFSKNHISSPASSSSASSNQTSSQRPGTQGQDFSVLSESDEVLRDKPKLSLAAQNFFLQCKWLQPQVLLCRCSCNQEDSAMTAVPKRTRGQLCEEEEEEAEEEEEESLSFDVNLLYSDSESDPQDSDDPDYVPSKRLKAYMPHAVI